MTGIEMNKAASLAADGFANFHRRPETSTGGMGTKETL
jgi:hypothetical protein